MLQHYYAYPIAALWFEFSTTLAMTMLNDRTTWGPSSKDMRRFVDEDGDEAVDEVTEDILGGSLTQATVLKHLSCQMRSGMQLIHG